MRRLRPSDRILDDVMLVIGGLVAIALVAAMIMSCGESGAGTFQSTGDQPAKTIYGTMYCLSSRDVLYQEHGPDPYKATTVIGQFGRHPCTNSDMESAGHAGWTPIPGSIGGQWMQRSDGVWTPAP